MKRSFLDAVRRVRRAWLSIAVACVLGSLIGCGPSAGQRAAQQQVDGVLQKLRASNPEFEDNSSLNFKATDGEVREVDFLARHLQDISPLQELKGLRSIRCRGGDLSDLSPLANLPLTKLDVSQTKVSDLSPLKHLKLEMLNVGGTQVTDLSPLQGMPLTQLICQATAVSDLSPLKDSPLRELDCSTTMVDLSTLKGLKLEKLKCPQSAADLSPLQGMPLVHLECNAARVSDLSPLAGMKLTYLECYGTAVSDLAPLAGMQLTYLNLGAATAVSDLTPLKGMPLTTLVFNRDKVHDLSVLRSITSLRRINTLPADDFWKQVAKEEKGD